MTEGVVLPGDSGSAITAKVDKAVVGILVCGDDLGLYMLIFVHWSYNNAMLLTLFLIY